MLRNTLVLFLFGCAAFSAVAGAEELAFDLDQARTDIKFTLADVLHTVHGGFQLRSGTIHFDPSTGKAGGEVIVDVATGNTGGSARDRKMHKDVLQSSLFPQAVFMPTSIDGNFAPQGTSELEVHGQFQLHGTTHDLTMHAHVESNGDDLAIALHSDLPYTQWGIRNPSTLFLRVSDKVQLDIRATACRNVRTNAVQTVRQ